MYISFILIHSCVLTELCTIVEVYITFVYSCLLFRMKIIITDIELCCSILPVCLMDQYNLVHLFDLVQGELTFFTLYKQAEEHPESSSGICVRHQLLGLHLPVKGMALLMSCLKVQKQKPPVQGLHSWQS